MDLNQEIDKVIARFPNQWEQFKTRPGLVGWFVGHVMRNVQGKANPKEVTKLVVEKREWQTLMSEQDGPSQ